MEKIFAVGDIHGCLSQLKALISSIPIDRDRDTLIFIGDYIDRGPDSRGTVDYVLGLRQEFMDLVFLKGNHEDMFLNFIFHGLDKELYLANGGDATLASYGYTDTVKGSDVKIPPDHVDFFRDLLLFYETDDYIFVHAGLRPGISLKEQSPRDMMWIRWQFIAASLELGRIVVFGHTPFTEPLMEPEKIGIDTGAVYGGPLTCLELPGRKIYQVPA